MVLDGQRAPQAWTGRPMARREDGRLLRGQGRFVDDLAPDSALVLEVLRSPYPSGRITVLDLSAALALPGVRAIYTGADLAGLGAAGVNALLPGRRVPMVVLAQDRVQAVGQAVAAVVAETRAIARDALDLIVLEVAETAPETVPVVSHRWGAPQAAEGLSVTAAVDHALVAPFALEPRACVARPEAEGLTVWLSTQTPQRGRDDLCAMLGLPSAGLRVIAPDVGGAFGGKASLMPEDVLTAFAALSLGRPVVWCASRSDEFLAATQGRGARTRGVVTVDPDGRLLALQAGMTFPLGHWMPYSALAPARNAGRILPGPYSVAGVEIDVTAMLTSGPAVNIYRGAGRPEAAILMERLMDKAAQRTGLDPLDFRRRNLAAPPAALPGGDTICSGDFTALLDRLENESGYAALRDRQRKRQAQGAVCGLGLALYVEPCGQGWETAALSLQPDGRFLALTGSSAQGQGRETAFAQIVADALGIAPDDVTVAQGDSGLVPEAIGALASRSTAIGGTAMWRACGLLIGQAVQAAAARIGCPPTEVGYGAGRFTGRGQALGWQDLAAQAPPLSADVRHMAAAEAWASGAVLAEVSVDPDTGAVTVARITWVDDAGTVINPALVEGQLRGGLAQGLGAALMERVVYRGGQLLTGSLMDYAVPRATDMPPVRLFSQPTRSPANALGAKGVGEAGCIGVPAAILNAVQDALLPFTDADLSLPLTSEQVWRALTGQTR